MLVSNLKQQFPILLTLIALTVTGCGFFGSAAPASEEAQVLDREAAIEREEGEVGAAVADRIA